MGGFRYETRVVNVRDTDMLNPRVVYIGRPMPRRPDLHAVGWGNPHVTGYCPVCQRPHSREEAIELYRIFIKDAIRQEPKIYDVAGLRGKLLACWCAPLPCHGDVLKELAHAAFA